MDGICELLTKMDDINPLSRPMYTSAIKDNNINGRVLFHCDLEDLKKVLGMNFGDWELFKVLVIYLRDKEMNMLFSQDDEFDGIADGNKLSRGGNDRSSRHNVSSSRTGTGDKISTQVESSNQLTSALRSNIKQSTVEKQVNYP